MPNPIMFTEAAYLFGPGFAAPRARRACADPPFETMAETAGIDTSELDPAVLREAREICARCACRKACRSWLQTGVFDYDGDPRCPNAALLHR